tara:strand:- start:254 stop:640 length:387 start_codon:yes stop_codon:yes gene_type:complete
MASQLKVDTITGVTTAGSISVTGEGNSTTTNLQQSLVKVWAKFNGSSFGELDSFNVSSFTDSGTGNYTVNINNDFSNANHASAEGSGAYHTVNDAANAAGTLNLACYNSSHSNADESRVAVHSCGDLA